MTVGFYLSGAEPQRRRQAAIMVESVHAAMPDIPIVQCSPYPTDRVSPAVASVWRCAPGRSVLEQRMAFYASTQGEWLLLDTDVVVQRDVRQVFDDLAFDVALTDRNWNLIKGHYKWSQDMPFNTGVVFLRTGAFYARAFEMWREYSPEYREYWTSEQWAVAAATREPRWRVLVLPGRMYNRPPVSVDEDVTEAAILHYKGPERKRWMVQKHMLPIGHEHIA